MAESVCQAGRRTQNPCTLYRNFFRTSCGRLPAFPSLFRAFPEPEPVTVMSFCWICFSFLPQAPRFFHRYARTKRFLCPAAPCSAPSLSSAISRQEPHSGAGQALPPARLPDKSGRIWSAPTALSARPRSNSRRGTYSSWACPLDQRDWCQSNHL